MSVVSAVDNAVKSGLDGVLYVRGYAEDGLPVGRHVPEQLRRLVRGQHLVLDDS